MKQWVVLCMLASVTFSGCLGFLEDDSDTDAATDDGMDDGNATANQTNAAPVIESFTGNQTEGEVPFDVTFAWNASDADGDNLTWTLDVDGDGVEESNGTLLPFNFTYTYDTAGTYNATLNVTDGTNSTSAVVAINATEPAEEEEGEGEGEEETGQMETGDWLVSAQNCPHVLALGNYENIDPETLAAGDGVFWGYFEVNPATIGKTWTLDAQTTGEVTIELSFYATDGSYIDYTFDAEGTVPADAGHGLVFPCGAGPGDFTYTVF